MVSLKSNQKGTYNLFDQDIHLLTFIAKVPLPFTGERKFLEPAVRPKLLLPHWKFKVVLHRESEGTVSVHFDLYIARKAS